MTGKDQLNDEMSAPVVEVLYICEKKHVTTINFHAQVKDFPRLWTCSTCHRKTKYVASASCPTEEHVPDPRRMSAELRNDSDGREGDDEAEGMASLGHFSPSHHKALHERRTNKELEALLQERLKWVRIHKISR